MSAATLVIRILADAKQAQDTMKKAGSKAGTFASGLGKATLPAAAVIGGLTLMGKAAADDARGQAILAQSLKNTAGATDAQVASSEAWISQISAATGVADDQLRPALASLARATGDVGLSQKDMGIALDVAAATGKDVTSVADAMAKGYSGNTGALKKLVPGLDAAAVKSGDMSRVMADLAKKTGGTAAKAADTAAGKMQRAEVAMNELQETAGTALIPVLGTLGGMLQKAATFGQQHEGVTKALVIGIGGLAVAILVLNGALKAYAVISKTIEVATKLWKAAQLQLNLAFLTNPIFLIIAIIIALVVAIVIAYKKSETFRKIVQGAWTGIKIAAAATWTFLKNNVINPFMTMMRVLWGAVKAAGAGIATAWSGLKSALSTVWSWIKTHVIDPLTNAFQGVADAISKAFDTVIGWIQKVLDWIGKIKIPAPVQKLIDLGKGLFAAPAAPATTTPTPPQATRLGATPRTAAGDRRSPADQALVVNVILDGKRVGGYLDRVISRRLDLEGARAAAGAWS